MRFQMNRRFIGNTALVAGILACVSVVVAQLAAAKVDRITVKQGDWNAPVENLQAVCRSAAEVIWREAPGRNIAPIVVGKSDSSPIVLYERGPRGEYQVLINIQGTYWAQAAYQFAHEFGHIWVNYRAGDNPQLWFEESLCEAASIYALRRMSETWAENPPYSNWKSYAPHLHDYAEQRIKAGQLPEGVTFAEWFKANRDQIVANPHDRDKNNVIIAVQLLKVIEAHPASWQALAFLNKGKLEENQSMETYFSAWHARVPKPHRDFSSEVAALFSVKVAAGSGQH